MKKRTEKRLEKLNDLVKENGELDQLNKRGTDRDRDKSGQREEIRISSWESRSV